MAAPANPDEAVETNVVSPNNLALFFGGFGLLAILGSIFFLLSGYGLANLRKERTFDLILLLFSLVLTMLAPFVSLQLGWDPLDYSSAGMLRTTAVLVPLFLVTIAMGWVWNLRLWLVNAAVFYAIYIVFYTTLFTNGQGFFTGMVGSLGYWLEQQAVKRGNQPWYFYVGIQIPIYEFLPAIGSLLALAIGVKRAWFRPRRAVFEAVESETVSELQPALFEAEDEDLEVEDLPEPDDPERPPSPARRTRPEVRARRTP